MPIFLSGRVAMDDGSALPAPATLERVCNGTPHAVGFTDGNGNFGIQLGNEIGVFQDASESGASGARSPAPRQVSVSASPAAAGGGGSQERMLMNCELQARLAGYRSQSVTLAGRRPLDNPNIGTILLHGDAAGEGGAISTNTLRAPKSAQKAFEKGVQFGKQNKLDQALASYQKAADLYPAYATAWYELGRIQASRGELETARESFDRAVKADPKYVNSYLQLSLLEMHARSWQKLADVTEVALKLNPFDYPQAFLYNAIANYNLQNFDEAEKGVRKAERLDTRKTLPQVARLLGTILAHRRDYSGAAEQFRAYLKLAPDASDSLIVRSQLARIEQLTAQKR